MKGGAEFVLVDAATSQKQPLFDHQRLAAAMSKEAGQTFEAASPAVHDGDVIARSSVGVVHRFADDRWTCSLADYACRRLESLQPSTRPGMLRGREWAGARPGSAAAGSGPAYRPDGQWEAFIDNYNVAVRRVGKTQSRVLLSTDGSEGNYYEPASISWAPNSKALAAYRIRAGYRRYLHYVESSPEDQLQPKSWVDALREARRRGRPSAARHPPDRAGAEDRCGERTLPNPYELSDLVWRKDGRALTFEYNQRGHQVYRVIECERGTGAARAVLSEEPKTFFYYNQASSTRDAGKKFRFDLADGRDVIWMSERDGWNHLYVIDGATGAVKNQITKGEWVVRGRRESGRSRAPDLVQCERHVSWEGPVFPALLPDQLRRHWTDATHVG